MNVYEKMWKQLKRQFTKESSMFADEMLRRMNTIMGEHYDEIVQYHKKRGR